MKSASASPDYFLDISDDVCPMTFVKTRLKIEKMAAGETVAIRLKGEEPLQNVPDSLTELGHRILSLAPEPGDAAGCHLLVVEKV